MTKVLSFCVQILIPDGEQPEGLRIIEKPGWIGQGLVFPRSLYPEIRQQREEELRRTGVYILWEPGQEGELSCAYVGEGDELRPRLDDHAKNKEFWTNGVAFTSKAPLLTKAHVRYLEARLIELASQAQRCRLDNATNPVLPSLPEVDRSIAELFLADMRLCLSILGVNFFERPQRREDKQDLFMNAKGISARGYESVSGFVVLSSSQAVKDEVPTIPPWISTIRRGLIEQEIFEDMGDTFRLVRDHEFSSPSAASGALLGRSDRGPTTWKDAGGRSLKEIRQAVES